MIGLLIAIYDFAEINEYANVVFDMLADFLLNNYNKFGKTAFEKIRPNMNRTFIDRFPFPASFEEQQYPLDDIAYPISAMTKENTWVDLDKWVIINPKVEYLKHYPL